MPSTGSGGGQNVQQWKNEKYKYRLSEQLKQRNKATGEKGKGKRALQNKKRTTGRR